MRDFYAKPFFDVLDMLVQFSFLGQDPHTAQRVLANKQEFVRYLRQLTEEMRTPEFDMCRRSIERLLEHLERGFGATQILHDAQDLRGRLLDQISDITLLAISQNEKNHFNPPEPLFGAEVEAKFSDISEDISEAGKCLALDRSTAAVFHLMRVTEKTLQHFGAVLGVKLATEKNWQNILDEVNKIIRSLDPKLSRTKVLAEAASHLYAVKVAWRNEVMHPKQTYTLEQAHEIYRNVRVFVRDIAELI